MTIAADRSDPTLASEIQEFISNESTGDFATLLLRLFRRQYDLNDAYQIYCDNIGRTPASVHDWQDVPAVPAKAFKIARLSCCAPDDVRRTFHSSGTTEGQPSRHFLDATALRLYDVSLRTGFYRIVPKNLPIIALMPPAADAPHSSLSYMLASLNADWFLWGETKPTVHLLDRIQEAGDPVCVFGTAFALLELFDGSSIPWKLPSGSYVIETGGFKGRTRQVAKSDLYAMIEQWLGVAPPFAIAEYGMSEMASQYYGTPASGFTAPHWLRTRIIDPMTELDSEEGLLRHYDLANWNSVAAIQTQDMARSMPNGAFELLGRASAAELRGCSLAVEERWASTL